MSTKKDMTYGARAFSALEQEIVSGRIPMGTMLREEALAARFGVSRGPLREALRRLEGRSLVVRTAHAGVRVVTLTESDMIDLYLVRENLEGMVARLAAERASDAELEELRDLLEVQRTTNADDTSYSQGVGRDDFHFRLAKASGSKRLETLLCQDMYSLIRLCRYATWSIPGQRKSHDDHERILEAVQNRDCELAELLMRRHVAVALRRSISAATAQRPDVAHPRWHDASGENDIPR